MELTKFAALRPQISSVLGLGRKWELVVAIAHDKVAETVHMSPSSRAHISLQGLVTVEQQLVPVSTTRVANTSIRRS